MTKANAARPRTPRPGSRSPPASGPPSPPDPGLDGPFELSGLGDIADPLRAESGSARIEWAQRAMPVLESLRQRFTTEQPFAGLTVAACLNVTAETAILVRALRAGPPARHRGVRPGRGGPAHLLPPHRASPHRRPRPGRRRRLRPGQHPAHPAPRPAAG